VTDQYNPNPALETSIFKAYDIRGIVDHNFTPDVVYAIGRAFASEAIGNGINKVVVAKDGRLSGPKLIKALTQGLVDSGCDVIDVGVVPTPVLYFATHHLNTQTGIMLTGSHNPPDYNGLKMVLGGVTLSGDTIQRLRKRIQVQKLRSGEGTVEKKDVSQAYLSRITSDVQLKRALRIIVDCGNGVAGELAPKLFQRLGCYVTELYCKIDGTFPNHHPDPSQPETLKTLIEKVKEGAYDLGLAFDGDGDRLGVISPDGEIIWPDRQMILYALDVLGRNPGAEIIYDIKCSRNLGKEIERAGGTATMWKTGHSLVKAKLKETGAPLAGEMSGHIFFKERWFGFDDALYTGARLLEILAADHRTTAAVFASLPNSINTPELRLDMREGEHYEFMKHLQQKADFPDAQVTTIDGLRVDFPDGFGLVRASNTTPCLVIRFEGDNEEAMERIQESFRALFHSLNSKLALPF